MNLTSDMPILPYVGLLWSLKVERERGGMGGDKKNAQAQLYQYLLGSINGAITQTSQTELETTNA